ncbi:FMN-linked oxidoreductase [Viridothelium virens]|uniref:FMN-linked oxidoreductase n=1 Tax=Viridothelium virens TaxID=1048519 RepID=A0A6A6HFG9_VIRVR|nr:FMN-linked oxidoreductase [Viridothelium virens]
MSSDTSTSTSRLFQPLRLGPLTLSHRIVMGPLTRLRASDTDVPLLPMVATHYAQRGCVPGTLLISESTLVSPRAGGHINTPGIWSAEQVAAWRVVTDAVHARDSFIFCQLRAYGRAARAEVLRERGGFDVVGASAVAMGEEAPVPRALREEEIWEFVGEYAGAARKAMEAGFDGVELHGANGYLIDQFTQDVSNRREDGWGGSVEKRSQFALEVTKAVVDAIGTPERVGIRLSPWSTFQGMKMDDPIPQFSHLVKELKALKLGYLHLVESRIAGNADVEATEKIDFAVNTWDGQSPIFVAGGFRPDSARRAVDEEYRDTDVAVVFGRYYVSNPDLAFRVKHGIEFTPYDRNTFYKRKSEDGYIDYPFCKEFGASAGRSVKLS